MTKLSPFDTSELLAREVSESHRAHGVPKTMLDYFDSLPNVV
jgi:hypothetical protein